MAAGRPAENPEFVLQANDVGITDIEEIRCPQIGGQILFLDFETNFRRILVAALEIVDRNRETLGSRLVGDHGRQEVGGECGDAAFAGQGIAEESDLPNLRGWVHDSTAWSACVKKQTLMSSPLSRPCRVGRLIDLRHYAAMAVQRRSHRGLFAQSSRCVNYLVKSLWLPHTEAMPFSS